MSKSNLVAVTYAGELFKTVLSIEIKNLFRKNEKKN